MWIFIFILFVSGFLTNQSYVYDEHKHHDLLSHSILVLCQKGRILNFCLTIKAEKIKILLYFQLWDDKAKRGLNSTQLVDNYFFCCFVTFFFFSTNNNFVNKKKRRAGINQSSFFFSYNSTEVELFVCDLWLKCVEIKNNKSKFYSLI